MISLAEKRRKCALKIPTLFQKISQLQIRTKPINPSASGMQKLFPQTSNQPLLYFSSGGCKKKNKPLRVGVVFSGGQAPGGHNVVLGLYEALKKIHAKSKLWGFLEGPSGIIEANYKALSEKKLQFYRNQGGFDLLGSGRTKIESKEQLEKAAQTMQELTLDGLVIIGGDDSNTNAAFLAEYFAQHHLPTKVIGVPKTIDGDLKNRWVEIPFGFDSACKTYAEIIGNISKDALSAKKYYHFIRLMGRAASHITLECALLTQPNLAFISEEVQQKNYTLQDLIQQLTEWILLRKKQRKNYGIFLIPEGLIEFIPEMRALIHDLNQSFSTSFSSEEERVKSLKISSQNLFFSLPSPIQKQLLLDRDPHGNVPVSKIETERLLLEMLQTALKKQGHSLEGVTHFLGYEGRSCLPTPFDAHYCYALGFVSASLVAGGYNGYMSVVTHLEKPVEKWGAMGIPLVSLLDFEERKGKKKVVIQKSLVDIQGKVFRKFAQKRKSWELEDHYLYPGPIQFFERMQAKAFPPFSVSLL